MTNLVKKIERILQNVNEKSMKDNDNKIKLVTNAFRTIEWLISIQHKDNVYQAFQIITKRNDNKKDYLEDQDEEDFP